MLRFTRRSLLAFNVVNWAGALFFAGVLAATLLRLPIVERGLVARHGAHADQARGWIEALMLLGFATVGCTHVIFVRLIAIVDAVAGGRPFAAANAARLRSIAWALLGIQLLDLGVGALTLVQARLEGRSPPWTPGVTGWIAVLLLFVLARVFGQGAAMQDEIEATV